MKYDFFSKVFVTIFAWLDIQIYRLIGATIQMILDLANLSIAETVTKTFIDRIYVVLALYVIFRLGITVLNAIANPELLTDQKQGVGQFLKRTVISMFLLIFVPTIFSELALLQTPILETIPKIVLGVEFSDSDIEETGHVIAKTTLLSLVEPNECSDGVRKSKEDQIDNADWNGIMDMALLSCVGYDGVGKIFAYDYPIFYSFIIGVIFLLIMISFVIDVSIRVIKMVILQIIAPIPIVSYMDPTSKNEAFSAWTGQLVSTYLELFTRMATIYLILFLITQIFLGDEQFLVGANGGELGGLAKVFLVLGILLFAKALPKYISKLLGIKDGGGGFAGLGAIFAGGAALLGGAGLGGALSGAVHAGGAIAGGADMSQSVNKGKGKALDITKKKQKEKAYVEDRNALPDKTKKRESAKADFDAAEKDYYTTQTSLDAAQSDYDTAYGFSVAENQAYENAFANETSFRSREPKRADFGSDPVGTANYEAATNKYNSDLSSIAIETQRRKASKDSAHQDLVQKEISLNSAKVSHQRANTNLEEKQELFSKAKQAEKSVSDRLKSNDLEFNNPKSRAKREIQDGVSTAVDVFTGRNP